MYAHTEEAFHEQILKPHKFSEGIDYLFEKNSK